MRIQTVHPFPARMAPELAINTLRDLETKSIVLDPMSGSGTVLRHAVDMGHTAIGFDVDPLAVLISRVWTRPVCDEAVETVFQDVMRDALLRDPQSTHLPWIDEDEETSKFIDYWFGKAQQRELRCISAAIVDREREIQCDDGKSQLDVLKVALSRIIITKEQRASLARDTSHSRPHKVSSVSDYQVFRGFEKSVHEVRKRLLATPPRKAGCVSLGDARNLDIDDASVDVVVTSPPYLNAIDYLRGHRLSLVWFGHRVGELRGIRSGTVGAERGPDTNHGDMSKIVDAMGCIGSLPSRYKGMVLRYAHDVDCMVKEVSRVLKPGGAVTFVVGNSCLKDVFVSNSDAICKSATLNGLDVLDKFERDLPMRRRYLPITERGNLGKRMRTETILRCEKQTPVDVEGNC